MHTGLKFFTRVKGVYGKMSYEEAEASIDQAIRDVALEEKSNTFSMNLSGGKYCVVICFAFVAGERESDPSLCTCMIRDETQAKRRHGLLRWFKSGVSSDVFILNFSACCEPKFSHPTHIDWLTQVFG